MVEFIQAFKQKQAFKKACDDIRNNPDKYEEFAVLHPELYLKRVVTYTQLDEKGRIAEAWKYDSENDTYKNITLIEQAKEDAAIAEAEYHKELRRQLMARQKEQQCQTGRQG